MKTISAVLTATLLGLALGAFVGFTMGFMVLFVLFADGTALYLFLRQYVQEPEAVVILLTTVSSAVVGGALAFSASWRYLRRRSSRAGVERSKGL